MFTSLSSKSFIVLVSFLAIAGCSESKTPETVTEVAPEVIRKATPPSEVNTQEAIFVAKGTFTGLSNHITTGSINIILNGNQFQLVLDDDFSLDGAPDPTLAFGNGKYLESTNFSKLNQLSGKQIYDLPSSIDPMIYTEVYVWCNEANVPLGVAKLEITPNEEALDDTYGS